MWQIIIVSCHSINTGNGSQSYKIFIGSGITHHSHRFGRNQNGKGLPDIFIFSCFMEDFNKNIIGFLEDL
jgi:hypothetical protein